jgi:hypothetical protein
MTAGQLLAQRYTPGNAVSRWQNRRHDMKTTLLLTAALAAVLTGATGCSDVVQPQPSPGVEPGSVAAVLSAVSATNLTGTVGQAVGAPPVVRVTDRNGIPVAGVLITFTVTGGEGTISTSWLLTGVDGTAAVDTWTLGRRMGANQVTAGASGLASVRFTAVAQAGPAVQARGLLGDNQIGYSKSPLAERLAVRIADAYDNPVAGATVTFAVLSGGGSIPARVALTDDDGIAVSGSWILGDTAAAQRVQAQWAGGQLPFAATALPAQPMLAFVRGGNIWTINIDGSGARQLTSGGNSSAPAWSPDGRGIAFIRRGAGIFIVDIDGDNEVIRSRGTDWNGVAWSPDGSKLAAATGPGIYFGNISVMSASEDGSAPVQLATNATGPAWSPDGSRIAYVKLSGDDGYDNIHLTNADGSGAAALTPEGPGHSAPPGWSPDGRRIAFSGCTGTCDVYAVNADGSHITQLTSIGDVSGSQWSPDGSWIAFTSWRRMGSPSVGFVSSDGREWNVIVTDAHSAVWRP